MTAAPPSRLAATLDHWKRNLLDLTKRNRAIHFRATPVSTLTLRGEQPADLYRRLVLKRSKMRFKADETKETERATDAASPAGPEPETVSPAESPVSPESLESLASPAPDAPQTLSAPPAPESPDSPESPASPASPDAISPISPISPISLPSDPYLQTTSSPDHLDRALRRLEEQARLSIEEQGVNTLFLALGFLHYTDPQAPSSEPASLRAPLLLVPVLLERKSARTGYALAATDDEPLVNPALAEYLRRALSFDLPDLPDEAGDEAYDLGAWLEQVQALIAEQRASSGTNSGWAVTSDCVLALFSFQKFVMYKDLEAHGEAMQQHELVQRLVARDQAALPVLPPDVQALDLDRDFPPETTAQVVDADSSQLRAIAAAHRGHTLVIEGPPGTGKSQTITNLIAQALANGKRVLFVAEKMAALEVVYRRLASAGLGEFCLELHSTKANKRAVIASLRAALDASLQRPPAPSGPEAAAARLPAARQSLTDYARAVHTPHGALGVSPYHAYGELESVFAAPRLRYTGPAEHVTPAELDAACRALDDLAAAAGPVGDPAAHPWRDTARTYYAEADLDDARALVSDLTARLSDLAPRAAALQAALDLAPLLTLPQIDAALQIAAHLAQSPGAPMAVLRSPAWDSPPPAALNLIASGRYIRDLWARVSQRFTPAVLQYDHAADIAYVEQKAQGALSFLAVLDGRWRDIRRRWIAYRVPGYAPGLLEQAQEMRVVGQLQHARLALAAADSEARQLFGAHWQAEASDWDALDAYVRWVVAFRALANLYAASNSTPLTGRALDLAARAAPSIPAADALRPALAAARQSFSTLRAHVGWPADYLSDAPLTEIDARARALSETTALAPRWAAFESARVAAAATLAAEVVPAALRGEVQFGALTAAFRRAFWQRWLAGVVPAREPLRSFHTPAHEQRVSEFRLLDEQVLQENRAALAVKLRAAVQQRLQAPEAAAGLPFLRREMARQRGLSPLRRTLQQAGAAIRAIKPCFMMSPLSVAQLLEGGEAAPGFDLVIFDEASQLPAEDAVGAIARGRQLIVVGDPKQLPPTNFFAVMNGQANAPLGDDGLPLYEDSESVLEEYLGAGVPAARLTWHYRSRHESLIAFSNLSFYDAALNTFPSVEIGQPNPPSAVSPHRPPSRRSSSAEGKGGEDAPPPALGSLIPASPGVPPFPLREGGAGGLGPTAGPDAPSAAPVAAAHHVPPFPVREGGGGVGRVEPAGLTFTFVPDGIYTGQGLNPAEARAVADAVVAHARAFPALTLGVGTFNLRQQQAIQDELEQRRRADPSLEPFFAARDEGAFFVKNLENIQGDERDVIFISVTYARDPEGRLRYNFGPLNLQNGWRRLNVLVTRARLHMRVFASIHGDDLDPATPSAGAQLLRRFLRYAEHGRLDDDRLTALALARQTAFEREVYSALTAHGLTVERQVGVSGYRIDFAVSDPALPGRYLLGLECDGLAYHAAPTARDRDRLRQQVLAARGWALHRLWSTDWFKDRDGQLARIMGLVEAARASALAAQAPAAPALGGGGDPRPPGQPNPPAPPSLARKGGDSPQAPPAAASSPTDPAAGPFTGRDPLASNNPSAAASPANPQHPPFLTREGGAGGLGLPATAASSPTDPAARPSIGHDALASDNPSAAASLPGPQVPPFLTREGGAGGLGLPAAAASSPPDPVARPSAKPPLGVTGRDPLVSDNPSASASPANPQRPPFLTREGGAGGLGPPPTSPISLPEPPPPLSPDNYLRPEVPAYRFAPGEGRYAGRDLLQAPAAQLNGAVARVVEIEYPLHLDDLVARVAGMWDVRLGSRIRARIEEAIRAVAAEGRLALRGDFAWLPGGAARVRSRAGAKIPSERIAPEEVRAAILLILGTGIGFPLPALANEVRALFGYGRATDALAEAVSAEAAALTAEGVLGEGSLGLMLRG